MRKRWAACLLALTWLSAAGPASAEVDEVRFGSAAHNILDRERKERSDNANMEIVFKSPWVLRFVGSPRPYMMVSSNRAGGTGWAGFGLYWRLEVVGGWVIEPGIGYVIHNGWSDIRFPTGDPRNRARILFGSPDLFRETIALERTSARRSSMQLFFEHLSHGQILGTGRNQGTEEMGARTIWRF
jgi:lipid A 3-O-deacylase